MRISTLNLSPPDSEQYLLRSSGQVTKDLVHVARHSPHPVLTCFQITSVHLGNSPNLSNDSPTLSKHSFKPDFPQLSFFIINPTHRQASEYTGYTDLCPFIPNSRGGTSYIFFPSSRTRHPMKKSTLFSRVSPSSWQLMSILIRFLLALYSLPIKERFKPKSLMTSHPGKFLQPYSQRWGQRLYQHPEHFRKTDSGHTQQPCWGGGADASARGNPTRQDHSTVRARLWSQTDWAHIPPLLAMCLEASHSLGLGF